MRRGRTLADIDPKSRRRSREQSSISFPYVDLNAAVEIARAIYDRCGNDACDLNDLAVDFGDGIGGAFPLKISAARIFDLIEKRGRSEARLTDSAKHILHEENNVTAKAHAFLRVPLYAALYDRFGNSKVPSRLVLEAEMKKLGVPLKQVDKARQVFERSARQAGFFETADIRLSRGGEGQPQIRNNNPIAPQVMMDTEDRFDVFAADMIPTRFRRDDPLIVGLVDRLPTAGSPWSDEARIAWLKLANSIFDVAYTDGSGAIEIKLGQDASEAP
jgi:hypothetical protein